MEKTMRVGTIEIGNGHRASIYIKARDTDRYLSISGVVGPLATGNSLGACGQIDMDFDHRDRSHNDQRVGIPIKPDEIKFTEGWNAEKWLDLLEIWHDYHLKGKYPACILKKIEALPEADKKPAWI